MSYLVYSPQPSTTAAAAHAAATVSGAAPRYNGAAKDIVLGPDGEPVWGNPFETLADETLQHLLIRRGRYPEFAPDFGTRFDQDARQPTPALQDAAFQADMQGQVNSQRDPAIKSTGGFTFTRDSADTLRIAFTITPVVGPTVPVEIPWSPLP